MKIINPATEEVIRELEADSDSSIHIKFQQLKAGKKRWCEVSLEGRVSIIRAFSAALAAHIDSLASLLTSEVGKPLQQSRNEINGARSRIQWMTDNAVRYLADENMRNDAGTIEQIKYEPLGIVCNISAWNYPYLVGVNVLIPALLAGNAVMYKPSEYASLTGLEIQRLLYESGVPGDVFQVALGAGDTGEKLLQLPFDGYFFTGSYKTGQKIYKKVAQKMVPCHCELGGKDPLYVADDVSDIRAVAAATADGAFYNNGQSCCSVERIYVHERVYDDYIKNITEEINSWLTGAPDADGVYIGPLTRSTQPDFLLAQVEDAVSKGAEIRTGGHRMQGPGYFFEPTLLVNVDHTMAVMKEESFGPLIGVMKVKDDEEAVRLMQDSQYGLTASVYSSSRERAEHILSQIDAGTGYWNCCDRVSPSLPWSGRKHSGFGVALSHAGLRSFTKPKAYHMRSNQSG